MALEDPQWALVQADPEKRSFRVHRSAYKSQEIFEREKALIFGKCWLYLGHGSELNKKGDFVTRRVGGRDIIFIRDKSGEIGAFFNTCTHRGAKVCRERNGNARNFSCPYHGWVFSSEGKLVTTNANGGYGEDLNADGHLDLRRVPRLENYRNFYFINYNPNAISLHDYLAGARDAIDAVCDQAETEQVILSGEHSYSIRANYKLLVENSYDGYHLVSVHASYFDHLRDQFAGTPAASMIDDTIASYNTRGAARGLGMGHAVLDSYVPTGRPVAQWLPSMGAHLKAPIEARRAQLIARYGEERADYIADTQKNLVIFPNLVINDIMSITVRYIEPEAPDFIKVTAWAMGPAEESEELRAMRLDQFVSFLGPAGFGSPDDIEMLEICQDAAQHTPVEWSELSKGMDWTDDPRTLSSAPDNELQMQAYWTQWDRVIRGIEKLERE
ncbi:aromatic ring-hydroxylating oxygenase subunit alpha [Sphingosinicella terrae]|uniref:aromatic ring-hydroxylating oxygenase subunit alpha n=1 Tax=Sphingosinicella terrae TaxID=2172047 RepID=UPI0013B389F7|nr:aromatic ring-hydroxylating dioxygenase subunit alpha [Sphingosinicella terrae]